MPSGQVSEGLRFDPLSLLLHSSPPMLVLSLLLVLASAATWMIIVIKVRQFRRWWLAEQAFRSDFRVGDLRSRPAALLASHTESIGGRLLAETLAAAPDAPSEQDAEHAMSVEYRRVSSGLAPLASIAAAAPLAGLFGTVYGIMEAFSRIGREKSAALPVVAPAIGDALITTALGLFAAIPAVIAFNLLSRRGELLLDESRTFVHALLRRLDNAG